MDLSTLLLGEPAEMERVDDFEIPGPGGPIPVRLVVPRLAAEESSRPLAVLVYFHGGGWVTGSIKSHDVLCREIAARSGVAVLSVDYRLAPEHPFPAAVDDAEAATLWISEHAADHGLDATRIAVGGEIHRDVMAYYENRNNSTPDNSTCSQGSGFSFTP